MMTDEITEVRRIRHNISARFDHDIAKIVAYYQEMERLLKEEGRYTFEEMPASSSLEPADRQVS